MKVTLKDIAREAAVSEGTASLALNDRPGVKVETKRRVQAIAQKYGYFPSLNARTLAQRRTHLVGVLVPDIRNLFYGYVVQEIENELRRRGYKMILATTANDARYEREMIEQFVSFRADGVILYPLIKDGHDPDYLDILRKNDIPLAFLGGYYLSTEAPHCMSNLSEAIGELVRHMHAGGCRRFLYMGSCRTVVSNRIKAQAMRDALADLDCSFAEDDYIFLEHTNFDCAYRATRELLAAGRDFDAIVAGDAYSGFGVYQALTEAGRQIPRDVAIAHMDNLIKPDICALRMTCVEQNVQKIAASAVQMLDDLIAGRPARDALIPAKVILRDSTRPV